MYLYIHVSRSCTHYFLRFEQSFLALSYIRTTWTPFYPIRLLTNGSSKKISTYQVRVWMWFFVLNNMHSSHLEMVSAMLIASSVQSSENRVFWTAIASQPSDHTPLVWAILYQPIKSTLCFFGRYFVLDQRVYLLQRTVEH